jgi:hypothetical protein
LHFLIGIIFDAAKDQLYIAGFGTTGSVQVATSTDNWESLFVHTAYNAACTNDGTTTLAVAGNSILAYCSNNFGVAPYNVSVLSNIVGSFDGFRTEMSQSSNITYFNMQTEGIEYHKKSNQLVLGSMGTGSISGVPPSVTDAFYSMDTIHTFAAGTSNV